MSELATLADLDAYPAQNVGPHAKFFVAETRETYRYYRSAPFLPRTGVRSASGGGQWVLVFTDPLTPGAPGNLTRWGWEPSSPALRPAQRRRQDITGAALKGIAATALAAWLADASIPRAVARYLRSHANGEPLAAPLPIRPSGFELPSPRTTSPRADRRPVNGEPLKAPLPIRPWGFDLPYPRSAAHRYDRRPFNGEPLADLLANSWVWTVVTDSGGGDTVNVFVSDSVGNDSWDGLAPAFVSGSNGPKKTIAAGLALLRAGKADHLKLKCGDTFRGQNFDRPTITGKSSSEPTVYMSYGTGARPLVIPTAGSNGIQLDNSGSVSHTWWIGIDFYAEWRDPDSVNFTGSTNATGLFWLKGTTDVLFEDCAWRFFSDNANVQDNYGLMVTGVRFRRCQFLDSYCETGHSQGIYLSQVSFTMEECLLDHNGWVGTDRDSPPVALPSGNPTIFNHSIYHHEDLMFDGSVPVVSIKNCVITRSSSHASQMRCGGTYTGNLLVLNPIGCQPGGEGNPGSGFPGGVDGFFDDNVTLEGCDLDSTNVRGWGWDTRWCDQSVTPTGYWHTVSFQRNVVAHCNVSGVNVASLESYVAGKGSPFSGNVIWQWDTSTLPWDSAGPFSDSTRTVEAYTAAHGGSNTFASFVGKLRGMSRQNWDDNFRTQAITTYIRQGFDLPAAP